MTSKIEYPVRAVFKNKNRLEKFLKRKGIQDNGMYLISGSNEYQAYYNPNKPNIIIKFNKDISIDQKTDIVVNFFKYVDNYLQ
ncbi:hypothetical protein CMI44_01165 [Candidatus Pacearchaeota archaeon]|jgi:hypothetical protein|nr:hypothetical protein [Candidatus Pacearchaeota archaeon]|tara:strand:- start:181 stop:429 length:249 start_codon:yes stop_codon:yes gene_type:complete